MYGILNVDISENTVLKFLDTLGLCESEKNHPWTRVAFEAVKEYPHLTGSTRERRQLTYVSSWCGVKLVSSWCGIKMFAESRCLRYYYPKMHAEPRCMRNQVACGTKMHAEPRCTRNQDARGTKMVPCFFQEPFGT